MTDRDDLAPLLAAAQAGDRGAFGMIYERFARAVHGIVLGRCRAEDAEDVTQDVFMAVQRKIDSVADAHALPGWICAVARNAATDALRKRERTPSLVSLNEPGIEAASKPGTDDGLAHTMLGRLRELPDAYRETLTMRLVEGLTGPEIAAATGLTPASVRVNLHRGMAKLRSALEKDGWP